MSGTLEKEFNRLKKSKMCIRDSVWTLDMFGKSMRFFTFSLFLRRLRP